MYLSRFKIVFVLIKKCIFVSLRSDSGVLARRKPVVLQLLDGMAPECEHKDCGDWQVNTSPGNTCFAFYANIHVSPPLRNNSRLFFSARVMDLESVMCELAGTSNTSIVPLLSLEKEQFML